MLADSQSFRIFCALLPLSIVPSVLSCCAEWVGWQKCFGKMVMLLSQPMAHVKLNVMSKREHVTPACQGVVCCFVCAHTNSHTVKSPSLGLLRGYHIIPLCWSAVSGFLFFFSWYKILVLREKIKYKENRCDSKVLGFTKTKLHIGRVSRWWLVGIQVPSELYILGVTHVAICLLLSCLHHIVKIQEF